MNFLNTLRSLSLTFGILLLIVLISVANAQPAGNAPVKTVAPAPSLARSATKEERENEEKRLANEHVVSIIGSGLTTTYSQFTEDIRNVLETDPKSGLRILPILGRTAGQGFLDVLYLKGIDIGVVNQDTMLYWKKKDPLLYRDVDRKLFLIAKLFNAELHVFARKDINSLAELRGKKVNCLQPLSAVSIMCETIFSALEIPVEITHYEAEQGTEKLKKGEIAAAVRVGGAPIPGMKSIKSEDNLHFVPIGRQSLSSKDFDIIRALYLPARLNHEDYPQLIPEGGSVPTVATSAVLAIHARAPGTPHYADLEKFVKLLFDNIESFRKPPSHPRWKDVALGAEVPGWQRFKAAQDWLDAHRQLTPSSKRLQAEPAGLALKSEFEQFLQAYTKLRQIKNLAPEQKNALFDQFMEWLKTKEPQGSSTQPSIQREGGAHN